MGFLSSRDVKALFSVNRVLFSIAMDERYKESLIGSLYSKLTHRSLKRLVDPEVASRVRTLIFKPGHICQLLQAELAGQPVDAFTQMRGSNVEVDMPWRPGPHPHPTPTACMPPEAAVNNILELMGQLCFLRTLQIEIRGREHWYFDDSQIDFLTAGWEAFGSNLRSLQLNVPLEDLGKVLPSFPKHLGSLENLSLSITRALFNTDETNIFREILIPFINTHHKGLRSLSFDVADQFNTFSPLLKALLPMPSLRCFKLKQPFVGEQHTNFSGLQHFFKVHRPYLTRFDLDIMPTFTHHPIPFAFFAQDCFNVPLPKLMHLSIHLQHFPRQYAGGMLPYIHQFRSTLRSLKVSHYQWTSESLQTLVEGFTSSGILKELEVSILEFSPDILCTLGANLPNLEVLSLDFQKVIPEGQIADPARYPFNGKLIPLFCAEMADLDFSQWRLRSLNLKPLHTDISERILFKEALANALPHVETFCGLDREEYISTRNFV
ncbi:hypothetical protein M413DRAFT_446811 [Hebeloma cylindrosporum]|uniref:F-box domain-containing protein n=1 Tax=Hebeloma cylindrosporum TaxID=76867 RepID=A0A0C3C8H2_HEBCY|nr:hypothetical protein M413DRAFT_446811 [Hebeloma cylindrosporum h7]